MILMHTFQSIEYMSYAYWHRNRIGAVVYPNRLAVSEISVSMGPKTPSFNVCQSLPHPLTFQAA